MVRGPDPRPSRVRFDPRRADEPHVEDEVTRETPFELVTELLGGVPPRCVECGGLGDEHDPLCPVVRD